MPTTIQDRGKQLSASIFTGGDVEHFEERGRAQFATLIRYGLNPWSYVLDIGCGCLRGGYWLIHFLDRDRYFGIEPNQKMLDAGMSHLLEPYVAADKMPAFDHNAGFDFSVFETKFDFFLAFSVWTHASKAQIETMLDGFVRTGTPEAVFFTTYLPARNPPFQGWWEKFGRKNRRPDYAGDGWVGRSHECDTAGVVYHSLDWIKAVCRERHLRVEELGLEDYQAQHLLRITHAKA